MLQHCFSTLCIHAVPDEAGLLSIISKTQVAKLDQTSHPCGPTSCHQQWPRPAAAFEQHKELAQSGTACSEENVLPRHQSLEVSSSPRGKRISIPSLRNHRIMRCNIKLSPKVCSEKLPGKGHSLDRSVSSSHENQRRSSYSSEEVSFFLFFWEGNQHICSDVSESIDTQKSQPGFIYISWVRGKHLQMYAQEELSNWIIQRVAGSIRTVFCSSKGSVQIPSAFLYTRLPFSIRPFSHLLILSGGIFPLIPRRKCVWEQSPLSIVTPLPTKVIYPCV